MSTATSRASRFDATGHTRQLTDAAGAVINRYRYDPFGEVVFREETMPNPFRYVGQFGVQASGRELLWMRARQYSPGLGRFLSADPHARPRCLEADATRAGFRGDAEPGPKAASAGLPWDSAEAG